MRFKRQRHVDSHLVAVEVSVKRRTHQRMQLDGFTFDENRLKRLNAKAMQGRCAIQKHWMFANYFFEQIPNQRIFTLNATLGLFDCFRFAHLFEAIEDKRLEQFKRHFLWQAALMQFELRAHHDH